MLSRKVVVITGGAGLLGQQIVRAAVQENAIVVIADIDYDKAFEFAEMINRSNNTSVDCIKMDINSTDSVNSVLETISSKYGVIDAIINNAYPRNSNYGRKFEDVTYEDFCENVSMHLGGYFLVSQKFAEFFKTQGFGNIINISSIYGIVAPRFEIYDGTDMSMPVEYAAIKSAILHMTKYIAKYYKNTNVRCNAISLGGLLDNQPSSFLNKYRNLCLNKGMLQPEDVVGSIIFLLSDSARYINGQNIIVDDGFTL